MTLTNDQEIALNTLIGIGQNKIKQDKAADKEHNQNVHENVCSAFLIPDNLREFVSIEPQNYEYGSRYAWLRIPGLLPIKLFFGERDYHNGYYTSGCTVMHGEEPHRCEELTEALAVAKNLADQPIPPAAMKIDEDTINAAHDELETATKNQMRFDPNTEVALELAKLKIKRINDILSYRTKNLLMERYQNQDG